ncbi:MAG: hypothetical protein HC880_02185 [Bacteroidia bacterium]|nr:hypothetical protein [Bacteroidia bacterium]
MRWLGCLVAVCGLPFSLFAQVTTFPYAESFENGPAGWIVSGEPSSWELGTPTDQGMPFNGDIIGASDGDNAWVTNLDGAYADDQESSVVSPQFNFSGIQSLQMRFDIWYDSEFSSDGAYIEVSTDGGNTWEPLGEEQSIYTGFLLSFDGPAQEPRAAWTGNNALDQNGGSGGYIPVNIDLSNLDGESNVRFRFVFKAAASFLGEENPGWLRL